MARSPALAQLVTRRLIAFAFLLATNASADPTVRIAGHVQRASGRSVVYVALWQRVGFLDKPVQTVRISAGASTEYRFDVAPGTWAVSAFEDTNGNGVLDMGMFGPKEPSGFWRAFTGWHKPAFDEVASRVDRDVVADITLR